MDPLPETSQEEQKPKAEEQEKLSKKKNKKVQCCQCGKHFFFTSYQLMNVVYGNSTQHLLCHFQFT